MKEKNTSRPEKIEREHHEIEDPVPKLLYILINHRVGGLRSPAHRAYGAILESWDLRLINRSARFCSVGWDVLSLRANMDRKAVKRWVRKMAKVGLIELQYIIFRKPNRGEGYENIPLIFSEYADAEKMLANLRLEGRDGSRNVGPYITPPAKLPTPEAFGLYLANNKDRYYLRRRPDEYTPHMGARMANKGDSNGTPSGADLSEHGDSNGSLNERILTEQNLNDSKPKEKPFNESEEMSFITNKGELVRPSLHLLGTFNSLPTDLYQTVVAFCEEHVDRFGILPIPDELQPAMNPDVQIRVRSNMKTLLEAGGDQSEWMRVEFDRLLRYQKKSGADFHAPRIEFLGNSASLKTYMSFLKNRIAKNRTPLLVRELDSKHIGDLLKVRPMADKVFIRCLAVIKTYSSSGTHQEYKRILSSFGFESIDRLFLRRQVFAYALLKYQIHFNFIPDWIYQATLMFSEDMFDEPLEEALLPKNLSSAGEFVKCNYREQ